MFLVYCILVFQLLVQRTYSKYHVDFCEVLNICEINTVVITCGSMSEHKESVDLVSKKSL